MCSENLGRLKWGERSSQGLAYLPSQVCTRMQQDKWRSLTAEHSAILVDLGKAVERDTGMTMGFLPNEDDVDNNDYV